MPGEGRINRLVPLHREEISEEGKSIVLWRVNAREIFTKPLRLRAMFIITMPPIVLTARVTASRVIFFLFFFFNCAPIFEELSLFETISQ